MLSLVAELDEFKGAWAATAQLAPDRLTALRQVATVESIGSSTRIEGSKLSDSEVAALLAILDIQSFDTRDAQEVTGYAAAMNTVFASFDAMALTENHIKQLHQELLIHSTKDAHHRGSYKTQPNHVSAFDSRGKEIGVVFETASPFDTPGRMSELIEWTDNSLTTRSLHPLLTIGIFTMYFLRFTRSRMATAGYRASSPHCCCFRPATPTFLTAHSNG